MESVIKQLNDSGLQIVLIVASNDVLIGTITDGDIRRGLLRGLSMKSSISSVVNRDAMVAPNQISRDSAKELMRVNKINALPVINGSRQVVGLYLLSELLKPTPVDKMMVIMAGGKGTRLRPYTENCPKPMLKVGGKPMLEHIINRAKTQVSALYYFGSLSRQQNQKLLWGWQ